MDCLNSDGPVAIALTENFLVGATINFAIWIWRKNDAELVSRISPEFGINSERILLFEPKIVALNSNSIAITVKNCVQIWDLRSETLLIEVNLDGNRRDFGRKKRAGKSVQQMIEILDENGKFNSLCCGFGKNLYRIALPTVMQQ